MKSKKTKIAEAVEASKMHSAVDHTENSRNSTHGYLEMGNDAEVHAKARAMRNESNGSHL